MVFFIAVYCTDLPVIAAALQIPQASDLPNVLFPYGTTISYQCLDGRRFEDGQVERSISCTINGAWNETKFTCEC